MRFNLRNIHFLASSGDLIPHSVDLIISCPPTIILDEFKEEHEGSEWARESFCEDCAYYLKRNGQVVLISNFNQFEILKSTLTFFDLNSVLLLRKMTPTRINKIDSATALVSSFNQWGAFHKDLTFSPPPTIVMEGLVPELFNVVDEEGSDGVPPKFAMLEYPESYQILDTVRPPISLVQDLIRTFSNKGETVLDPFAQKGSIVKIAQLEKRFALGFESNSRLYQQSISPLFEDEFEKSLLMD